jgi:hypothetical protein
MLQFDESILSKAKGESDMSENHWTRNATMALISLSFAVAACSPPPPVEKPSVNSSNASNTDSSTVSNIRPISTPTPKAAGASVPSFEGRVGDASERKKFFDFLSDNERSVVKVDVNLSGEQMESLKKKPVGEKILWVDLTYKASHGGNEGAELLIDLSGGENDLYFDQRPSSQRIQSYLKIVGIQGPQMGIFSIRAVPVAIESIRQ